MEDKIKNLILGTIYSILLIIIFTSFINKLITFLLGQLYPTTSIKGTGSETALITPVFGGAIISIVISLVLTYAIIRLVKIEKINEFLNPNKYKISITVIALTVLVIIGAIIGFYYAAGNPNDPVLDGIIDVLMLGANYSNGFMIWFFPIIAYYLIVCLVYKKYVEKKTNV